MFTLAGEPPAPKPSAISAKPSSWKAPVIITLIDIAIAQDKSIGILIKINNSPKIPDRKPIRNPTKGKDHAALVRSGASLEKYDQFIGILVKKIILANNWNYY